MNLLSCVYTGLVKQTSNEAFENVVLWHWKTLDIFKPRPMTLAIEKWDYSKVLKSHHCVIFTFAKSLSLLKVYEREKVWEGLREWEREWERERAEEGKLFRRIEKEWKMKFPFFSFHAHDKSFGLLLLHHSFPFTSIYDICLFGSSSWPQASPSWIRSTFSNHSPLS